MDHKNESIRFQPRHNSPPTESWWAEAGPVAIHQRTSPGLVTSVGSNLRFYISGFTFLIAFRYATSNRKILTLVCQGLFSILWLPWWTNLAYSRALPHPENDRQWSVNNFWSCIFGNMSGAWVQASIKMDMAAFIGRYVQDIPATASRIVTTYYIYRATTKYAWAV